MKKIIIIGVIVIVVLFAGLMIVARTFYPTNIADTSPNHEEEKLRTRHYKTDLPKFTAEAEKLIPQTSTYGQNWKFISTTSTEDSAIIKAEVPVVFFTDDLQVKAEKDTANSGIIVNIHSNSRVGKSDFGENRRHVLQILQLLDEKFSK
jgi:uncharacterized protein (DUF1499 family)